MHGDRLVQQTDLDVCERCNSYFLCIIGQLFSGLPSCLKWAGLELLDQDWLPIRGNRQETHSIHATDSWSTRVEKGKCQLGSISQL